MLFSQYVLRGLILAFLALLVAFLALPFVLTSRALDEHGITIPGTVYHKSEWVKVTYSGWELSRDITIEYTVPETSSVTFFKIYPDIPRYDSLHTKQAVQIRYLPRKFVPDVPGARVWWELHALPVAKLANDEGVSRLNALRTPGAILGGQIIGGILAMLILWRVTRSRLFAWAAGVGGLALFAFILYQGFPRPTPAPTREIRHATGRVAGIGRIDKMFSGSRSRGIIADQPIDVVSIEFVPDGMTEPVVAVDLIDRGSLPGLKEKAAVNVDYEAASPRTAYLVGAARQFPERNLSGAVLTEALSIAVVIALLGLVYWFGRGYRRLVNRR